MTGWNHVFFSTNLMTGEFYWTLSAKVFYCSLCRRKGEVRLSKILTILQQGWLHIYGHQLMLDLI